MGLEAVLLARLQQTRLLRAFRWFSLYLACNLACDVILIWIPFRSTLYYNAWTGTEIVLCITRWMVGFELWERICAPLQKLKAIKGLAFVAAVAPAGGLSLAVTHAEFRQLGSTTFQYAIALADHFSWLCIAAFAAVAWVVFQPFRTRWSANTVAHWRLLTLYSLLMAASWISVIFGGNRAVLRANFVMLAGNVVLYFGWSMLLTAAGERITPAEISESEVSPANGEG